MERWVEGIWHLLSSDSSKKRLVILGIGNPVKGDDSVGLYVVDRLRKAVGARPSPLVTIHRPLANPELALSKIDLRSSRLLLVDAVEAGLPPGSIVFVGIDDTRYGFFGTHNLPLRLNLSLREDGREVFILGVQPQDVRVGEGLSQAVRPSAERIVGVLAGQLGGV